MSGPARILVVEDDRLLLEVIGSCLRRAGYAPLPADRGSAGLAAAQREQPELVLLDLVLPDLSGIEVCRELRARHYRGPIIMLTGQGAVEDRVRGLDAGADDYLSKPFDERELLARIRAHLRRREESRAPGVVVFGEVRIDLSRRTATRAGEPLALTKTEFALLDLLLQHEGRPVARDAILSAVWGYSRIPDTRTVDTHIWRLRRKLGDNGSQPRWLKRISGQGFVLSGFEVEPAPNGGGA